MFIDEAKIYVKAGDGGNGCVSFRREKFVPRGGPDGGDGGNGGSIIFVVDKNMNTLIKFKYRQHFKVDSGKHGMGAKKYGHSSENVIISVPLGTIARDEETGKIIADLSDQEDRVIIAHGGKGGKGNAQFATATNQAPQRAEKGLPGEGKTILLELKPGFFVWDYKKTINWIYITCKKMAKLSLNSRGSVESVRPVKPFRVPTP